MGRAKKESKTETQTRQQLVPIYVFGRRYDVPENLTIQKAMEYAGYQYVRNCGCRGGVCGACVTEYRTPGSYRLKTALACQTVVETEMQLAQIPFVPSRKEKYDVSSLDDQDNVLVKYYPELMRCVQCNTCTRVCPQELQVMDYIAAAMRGDIQTVAELSFECIMCGTCAAKCPAELSQHQIALLARRIWGCHGLPSSRDLEKRIREIQEGKYETVLGELMDLDTARLRKIYAQREQEPQDDTDWTPKDPDFPQRLLRESPSSNK